MEKEKGSLICCSGAACGIIVNRKAHSAADCGMMAWTRRFLIHVNTRVVFARKNESDSSNKKMYQI